VQRILYDLDMAMEKGPQRHHLLLGPGGHFDQQGRQGVSNFPRCLKNYDVFAKITKPHFLPGEGGGGNHLRIDMVIYMEDAVLLEVAEIFLICLLRLEIGGGHGTGAGGDGRTGMVGKNLNNIIFFIGRPKKTASFADHRIYTGMVEGVAIKVFVDLLADFHHITNHLDSIHRTCAKGNSGFGFLAGGTPYDQDILVGVLFNIMRNVNVLAAEVNISFFR